MNCCGNKNSIAKNAPMQDNNIPFDTKLKRTHLCLQQCKLKAQCKLNKGACPPDAENVKQIINEQLHCNKYC